jgi:fido (protein-threonine AMPylation protein)/transcriptional regulator with XRE-family HTH domain
MTIFVLTICVNKMILGIYIAEWRAAHGLTVSSLAQLASIDQALVSKYENGKRVVSENHLIALARAMGVEVSELRAKYLVDKIAGLLEYEVKPHEILMAAEDRITYLVSKKSLKVPVLSVEGKQKLSEIDVLHTKWKASKPLQGIQLQKMEEYFNTRYTFDSNRIEGNTLTFQETHLVVAEGLTIGGKSMVEHLEAINHTEAIAWLQDMVRGNEDVSRHNVLDIHRLILKSIDSNNAGVYRSVPVMIGGSEHKPPQPYMVEKLMEDYYVHYQRQKRVMHPVILAAEMHERLVSIHPFIDGNGRTSRLVMNFILLKNGFTVTSLKGDYDSRMAYYAALEDVQVNNNPEPFYHLILDKVRESLEEHLEMV